MEIGNYKSHSPPPDRNRSAYAPASLETAVGKRWEQLTQIGDVSERVFASVNNNVALYKRVLEEGGYGKLVGEMETELDRIFVTILSKLGNKFKDSPFGALHREYSQYFLSKKEPVEERIQYPLGIGATTKDNPVIALLQPLH